MMERFNRGRERRINPEYSKYMRRIARRRRAIRELRERGEANTPAILELKRQIEKNDRARKALPSREPLDLAYRRLWYCRYADDSLIAVIGSKNDASDVMAEMRAFIEVSLHLHVAENKSKISHATEGTIFLGYEVISRTTDKIVRVNLKGTHTRTRAVAERMTLRIPEEKLLKFCHEKGYGDYGTLKAKHRYALEERSDVEIIMAYNAELRGLANYYSLAFNAKRRLHKLQRIWEGGLFKTLAAKHKMSVTKTAKKLRRGNDSVCKYEEGKMKELLVFSLRRWKPSWSANRDVDIQPYTPIFTMSRTEIVQRLNAGLCEYCGVTQGYFEVHHARKLADIKDGTSKWQKVMSAMRRKTLVLCNECHDLLHSGRLPDWRWRSRIEAESRMN
jgi:hypothetical protein